jgi:hypothetical protein
LYIDLGQSRSELRFQDRQLIRLAAALKALDETVKRPDIVKMLGASHRLMGCLLGGIVALGCLHQGHSAAHPPKRRSC